MTIPSLGLFLNFLGDVFAIKREENSKYNYLVEEANPDSKLEHINLIE